MLRLLALPGHNRFEDGAADAAGLVRDRVALLLPHRRVDVRNLLAGHHLAAIVDGATQDAVNGRLDIDGLPLLTWRWPMTSPLLTISEIVRSISTRPSAGAKTRCSIFGLSPTVPLPWSSSFEE